MPMRLLLSSAVLVALATALGAPGDAMAAESYRVARAADPAPDDPLRDAKLKDRQQVSDYNRAEARRTAARDRARIQARDNANARAQARYQAQMADWRRRVAACEAGNHSQCGN